MRHVISNFIALSPENVSEPVYWAIGVIYLMFIGVSLASVFSKSNSLGSLLAWGLLVIGLPVLGIAAHCFRCLIFADYHYLKQFGIVPMKNRTSPAAPKL